MSSKYVRWIHPYLLAILAVFLACQAIWFIQPYISISPPFITFLAAIMFTAWYGGFRPALLATLLSAVTIDYYFIVPLHSFPLSPADLVALAFFGCIATAMAYSIDHLQRGRHDAVTLQKQLEQLYDLSVRLLNEEDFEHTLQRVLIAALELLGADKGMIHLYDKEKNTLEMMIHIGCNNEEFSNHFQHVSLESSFCGAAFHRKQRVIIENVATDPTFSQLASLGAMSGIVSAQSMPLFRADRGVFGVLTTYHSKPPLPSDGEFRLVDLYARQAERVLEAKYNEEDLRRANADLEATQRGLISELADTEERERRHLASELHDYLVQLLALGQIKLKLAQRFVGHSPGKSEQYIRETAEAISLSLEYARTLMAELCPPELYDSGLLAAVQWLARQMPKYGLNVELNLTSDSLELPKDRAVLLYKSIRELLMNVVKHAMVDRARVSMGVDSSNTLVIGVQDEGRGFDTSSAVRKGARVHFGLANISERITVMGGWCLEESAIGHGTTITLGLPLQPQSGYDALRAASADQRDRVKAKPQTLPTQESLPLG